MKTIEAYRTRTERMMGYIAGGEPTGETVRVRGEADSRRPLHYEQVPITRLISVTENRLGAGSLGLAA